MFKFRLKDCIRMFVFSLLLFLSFMIFSNGSKLFLIPYILLKIWIFIIFFWKDEFKLNNGQVVHK